MIRKLWWIADDGVEAAHFCYSIFNAGGEVTYMGLNGDGQYDIVFEIDANKAVACGWATSLDAENFLEEEAV